jgi:uncharacterized repeat protein (TIGR01451 family)
MQHLTAVSLRRISVVNAVLGLFRNGLTAWFLALLLAAAPTALRAAIATTTLVTTSPPGASVFGQSVMFNALVSPVVTGTGTPTGTVTFFDGGSPLGTVTLPFAGPATFTAFGLVAGTHPITVTYSGDANFIGSTAAYSQAVSKADTVTSVPSSVPPAVFGQSVTLMAFVSLSPSAPVGAGSPTGSVNFFDSGTPIGTGNLVGGIATYTTSSLSVGPHLITAIYPGNSNFNLSGTLSSVTQTVNKADTTTAVTSSMNPALPGQSVMLTAAVSPVVPGSGTPTGTLTFFDGGNPINSGTLSSGVATFTTSSLTIGNHAITASYGGDGNFNISSGSLTGDPQVIALPDLIIAKSHFGTFSQGDVGDTYTLTASNIGLVLTSGLVTVTDILPAGLTPTAASGSGWATSISGQTVTATRSDSLAAGSSYPAITLTVNVANNAPSSVTNTATVSGGAETNTSNDSAADPTTIVQKPDLTISKSHIGNFSQGDVGDIYTLTISNSGSASTSGLVVVSDTLPAGLTPTAASGTGWATSISGQTVTTTRSDALAAGSSYPAITLTVSVANNAPASVTNVATVSGGGETNTGNDSAADPTIVVQKPDLTIAKSHAGNFTQGQTGATYILTVSNVGFASSSGLVTVSDTLPTGLTPSIATGTGWTTSVAGQTVTATRSDALAASGSYPAITLTADVANNAPASVTNTATVFGGGETNTSNDSASDPTTIVQLSDLTISKSHIGNFSQGDVGDIYTLTISNPGSASTSGLVTVSDTLPAGLTPTAASGTGWATSISGQTVTATRSDALTAGSSYPAIALTVNVANNAPPSVTNTAVVSGGGETNTGNDSASDPTTIVQLPDLTIAKSHAGNFSQGQTGAAYTLTVSNAGFAPTSGPVTVTDTLPSGLTATAISGTGWGCTLSPLACTRSDTVAAGGSYSAITLTVSVANSAPASLTNTATVSGGGESNTSNDSASDATTIAIVNFTIGGNVGGATSPAALTLNDTTHNTSQSLSSSGAFTFLTPLPIGSNWDVAVTTPPSGQSCVVVNGSGANLSANVSNVQVTCTTVLVTLAPATLPAVMFGQAYSQQLGASSSDSTSHAPYTFTLTTGSLPSGVTLSASGLLSGTPNAVGSFSFTVQAAGSGGVSGAQAYMLVVNKKTTTVTLSANPNPAITGAPVTLTATVEGDPPTGTVSFSDNGLTLPCSPVTLVAGITSSTATCTTTFMTPGAHSVIATYAGDASFVQATSSITAVSAFAPLVSTPMLDRWMMLLLGVLLGTTVLLRRRST